MGKVVRNLFSGQQSAGSKKFKWDATNNNGQSISAGVYFYSIEAGQIKQTKKMVLLK